MKTPKFLLIMALLLVYSLGFSQVGYKSLLRAAQDSTQNQNYHAAIKLLLKAKNLKGKDSDYSEKINMYLGNNYESINRIDSCIYYYGEAVKYGEKKKDYPSLSFLFSRLANIELSITNQYENAIRNFKKQLFYDKLLKDSVSLFDCLNNIGIAYKSLKQNDTALLYFKKVATDNSVHNSSKNTALILLADTYSQFKKYLVALKYYDGALKNLILTNDSMSLYTAYANKGDCLMQQNRFDESLISLKKAQQFLLPYITATNKAALYYNFAYVYSKQRVYDKAFYYKNLENITLESIKTESIGNAVAEMSAKYELRQKQDSLFINSQKLVLADAKADEKERNFIILLIASIAILIVLISVYRIRQLRFKNTLQKQEAEQQALNLTHQYQLSESELKAIRSQMNPHFIFNVLNSIESYIMDNDKRTASRLIQKFASLSRLILENSTKSLVAADKEWKALTLYTELEAMRYNNSFTYSFSVEDGIELQELLLPPMLIQPLIENAILHGIIVSNIPDAHISVNMQQNDQNLCITVQDNGAGLTHQFPKAKVNSVKEKSIGIESIKERIALINSQYQAAATFTLSTGENNRGTTAKLILAVLTSANNLS